MGLFDFMRRKPQTATTAKNRLNVVITHERSIRNQENSKQPLFIEAMKNEILRVVNKYVNNIDLEEIDANIKRDGENDILSFTINLPDTINAPNTINTPEDIQEQKQSPALKKARAQLQSDREALNRSDNFNDDYANNEHLRRKNSDFDGRQSS